MPRKQNPKCVNCGKSLTQKYTQKYKQVSGPLVAVPKYGIKPTGGHGVIGTKLEPQYVHTISDGSKEPTGRYGQYEDGYFCSLRCGYDFGLMYARAYRER